MEAQAVPNQYVIKSAHRTLNVLLAFGAPPHSFSLAELLKRTGIEKNKLYRSLRTLEAAGFLSADEAGCYALTDVAKNLGAAPIQPVPEPIRQELKRQRRSGQEQARPNRRPRLPS